MSNALIVWGGWETHQPRKCSEIIKSMLKSEGMNVQMVEGASAFADPAIAELDLIVPVITMDEIEREAVANLVQAVEAGVGLAGYHGGMGDTFRNSTEFQFMVGGQFVAHPGNIIDYRVNIANTDDPVMAGLADFDYRSEQYYMHTDPSNKVLATTTFSGEHAFWTKDVTMPVAWKRHHGKGRVFYSSLGHEAAEFDVPEMKTILQRGMKWAAGI